MRSLTLTRRHFARVIPVVLCVAMGLLAFASAAALASPRSFSSFGSLGSGAGEMSYPTAVAVNNSTHDVYVTDLGNHRVDEFTAEGAFVRAWGWGVADGFEKFETCTLICQAGTAGSGPGEFEAPVFIAVDNSGGPSDGDVYVADTSAGLIQKFTAEGALVSGWGDHTPTPNGQLSGSSATPALAGINGIAVVPAGAPVQTPNAHYEPGILDVIDNERLFSFSQNGTLETSSQFEISSRFNQSSKPEGLTIDSAGNVFFAVPRGNLTAVESTYQGKYVGEVSAPGWTVGMAVDTSTGELYVDRDSPKINEIDSYAFEEGGVIEPNAEPLCRLVISGNAQTPEACNPTQSFGSGDLSEAQGLAVDPANHTVLVADSEDNRIDLFADALDVATGGISKAASTTVTLNGTVNPRGRELKECLFEYGETTNYGQTAACTETPAEIGSGSTSVTVHADIAGLAPITTYHFRLVASNSVGGEVGGDQSFLLPASPTVSGESVGDVGSTTATVLAHINPGGVPTSYRVEYGTSTAYGYTSTETNVGAGIDSVEVQAPIGGLQSGGALFHCRIVATNTLGTTLGDDLTFVTQGTLGPSTTVLADNRAYEMVSPVEKADGNVYVPEFGTKYTATSGSGVFLTSPEDPTTNYPFQASADGNAVVYLADPLAAQGNGLTGNGEGNQFFAQRSATSGWATTDISPFAKGGSFYQAFSSDLSVGVIADTFENISSTITLDVHSNGVFSPLFTSAKSDARLSVDGLSSDGSHALFATGAALTPNAPNLGAANNLYDAVSGQLYLVNVLPNGMPDANATFGGKPVMAGQSLYSVYSDVISEDGSRIFWTDLNNHKLYVRENDTMPQSPLNAKEECTVSADACTLQVDATHGPEADAGARYQTASSDGSRVFFTSCSKLTEDSTAVCPGGEDLYEYNVTEGTLTDLSVDHQPGDTLGAEVQGVAGASADGSYVYFIADGVLAGGATAGQPNLYVSDGGAAPAFIATLAGAVEVGPGNSSVTPDGRHLLFQSLLSLTGYDNEPTNSEACRNRGGGPVLEAIRTCNEVFLYDVDRNHLACVSCDPSGAPPADASHLGGNVTESAVYEEGEQGTGKEQDTYHPRWMSDDGNRVFFDTGDALVPQDSNGRVDVYEWERGGDGTCQQEEGCVNLISGGISTENSYFVDAGENGGDVFFVTRAQLASQDRNFNVDLYDARVNGGFFPLTASECSGSGCQGVPPAPPIFATPSSVTFNGVGNFPAPIPLAGKVTVKSLTSAQKLAKALKVCRKKVRKQRAECEKQARRRYAPAKKRGK
jgi:hypothetical protein